MSDAVQAAPKVAGCRLPAEKASLAGMLIRLVRMVAVRALPYFSPASTPAAPDRRASRITGTNPAAGTRFTSSKVAAAFGMG